MSWRMAIRHRTGYRYAGPVRASYNEARLTPPSVDGQRTLQAALAITPAVRPLRYVDYWGTTVDAFDIHVPHTELVVLATSTVETAEPRPLPADAGWADLADPAVQDRFGELLAASPYVPVEPELAELGRSLRAGSTPVQAGLRAAAWTHETLRYERGATHVHTSSAEARAAGKGVCQDFAHVTLALLRAVGLPARYVSGYLHPTVEAEIGETTAVRATPGWSSGPVTGSRSTRPASPTWAAGTCCWPAAATTPTYGRCPASTPAPQRSISASRSRSPGSADRAAGDEMRSAALVPVRSELDPRQRDLQTHAGYVASSVRPLSRSNWPGTPTRPRGAAFNLGVLRIWRQQSGKRSLTRSS